MGGQSPTLFCSLVKKYKKSSGEVGMLEKFERMRRHRMLLVVVGQEMDM